MFHYKSGQRISRALNGGSHELKRQQENLIDMTSYVHNFPHLGSVLTTASQTGDEEPSLSDLAM